MTTLPITLDDVRDARRRIAGRLVETPLVSATRLGAPAGVSLWLKLESLQKTGSFKARGALARIDALTGDERRRGVIAVSAGNHAQGVAWAATAAGVESTLVMSHAAPKTKVDATRGYGGTVVQHGDDNVAALARARELEQERGYVFVHPFDDVIVSSGAGTVGLEILEQLDDVDAIVVPIGGGGLIAGIAAAVKALTPGVAIYGVEPERAPSMRVSLDENRATGAPQQPTIADGLAAPYAGKLAFEMVRALVDDVVLVTEDEIADAMRALAASAKVVSEGAGAAGVAAVMSKKLPLRPGSRVVAVVTGGNVDAARLAGVLAPD